MSELRWQNEYQTHSPPLVLQPVLPHFLPELLEGNILRPMLADSAEPRPRFLMGVVDRGKVSFDVAKGSTFLPSHGSFEYRLAVADEYIDRRKF